MSMPEYPPNQMAPGLLRPVLSPEAKKAHDALHGIHSCPNCGHEGLQFEKGIKPGSDGVNYFGHPEDSCLLVSFISILSDRGNLDERELFERMVECDSTHLWEKVGPALNALEDGELS